MEISWLGNKSFLVTDEVINVFINPDESTIDPSLLNDSTVFISTEINDSYSGKFPLIDSPGEYEINNVSITGIANGIVKADNKMITTCFKLESRGLSLVVVGDIGTSFDSEGPNGRSPGYNVHMTLITRIQN